MLSMVAGLGRTCIRLEASRLLFSISLMLALDATDYIESSVLVHAVLCWYHASVGIMQLLGLLHVLSRLLLLFLGRRRQGQCRNLVLRLHKT